MKLLLVAGTCVAFVAGIAEAMTSNQTAGSHFSILLSGPATVKVGNEVSINVDLVNSSKARIVGGRTFSEDDALINNTFYVKGPVKDEPSRITEYGLESLGKGLRENPKFDVATRVRFEVAPGEEEKEKGVLNAFFDMTQPGQYTAQIKNRLADGSYVLSNIITIEVTR